MPQEGAWVVGGEELITSIAASKGGSIDFDRCVATPDMMKLLAKIGEARARARGVESDV